MNKIIKALNTIVAEIKLFLAADGLTNDSLTTDTDGTNESSVNEKEITDFLQTINEKYAKDFEISDTKYRDWKDIFVTVHDGKKDWFVPINIKCVSNTQGCRSGAKLGGYYALTGINKEVKSNSWQEFAQELLRDYKKDLAPEIDYYFIIVDKRPVQDDDRDSLTFWTSLKRIPEENFQPNGSNPPFLIKWDGRKLDEPRTNAQMMKLYVKTLAETAKKQQEGFIASTKLLTKGIKTLDLD